MSKIVYEDLNEQICSMKINGKYGLAVFKRVPVVKPIYDRIDCQENGFFRTLLDGKFGLLDSKCKEIAKPIYDNIMKSDGDVFIVELKGSDGFIGLDGKEITPAKYDAVRPFSDGIAIVKLGALYGFINREGKEIITPIFDFIEGPNEGLLFCRKNGKWGIITLKDEKVFACKYDTIGYSDGFIYASLGDSYALLGKDGKPLTEFIYSKFCYYTDGVMRTELVGERLFFNKDGKAFATCDEAQDYCNSTKEDSNKSHSFL